MNALTTVAMPLQDMQTLAVAIAKSGLFGIKTPEQALVLMAIAQAEGRHPVEAARDYDIINNRPAKKAEAMLRDFIKAGGTVKWHSLTDELADATFTHPQTGEVRIDWDMKRAQTAFGKKDMYSKFPRQMLRSRVVSEGVRTLWPLATSGFYVPEEQADIPTHHDGPTIEHAASDEREQMNRDVPLKAAAADMTQAPRISEPPPKATPRMPRTGDEWNTWVDKLEASLATLYRRSDLLAMTDAPAFQKTLDAAPPRIRRDIDELLRLAYERLPETPVENDPTIGGDDEVLITGERNVMAG